MSTLPDTERLEDVLRALAEEAASARDLFLVEMEVRGHRGSRVIEIYLDGDEGVEHDALSAISRQIEEAIDAEDLVKGRFHLNVSSPGTDRPLLLPRQYRKHVGRELAVTVRTEEAPEPQRIEGVLADVGEEGFTLEVPGPRKTTDSLQILFADVEETLVKLPW